MSTCNHEIKDDELRVVERIQHNSCLSHNMLIENKKILESKTERKADIVEDPCRVKCGTIVLLGGLTGQKLFELVLQLLDCDSLSKLLQSSLVKQIDSQYENSYLRAAVPKLIQLIHKENIAYCKHHIEQAIPILKPLKRPHICKIKEYVLKICCNPSNNNDKRRMIRNIASEQGFE